MKETQELEIKKLELQLQLAQLQGSQPISLPSGDLSSSGKSLGDLKAPQKTLHPQQWPHIYAPGEPKLYTDLTLAEFCAGYLVILQQSASSTNHAALLAHFHHLMVLASTYKWSAVRSFHYKVLRSLELGLVKWGDSFDHFKQPFITPSALLSETNPKTTKPPVSSSTLSPSSTPSVLRSQICDEWSWYNNCSSTTCPKQHICVVCKRPEHQAISCPKRKFPVPSRRTDPPSQA